MKLKISQISEVGEFGWMDPWGCDPPHKITHPEKYEDLVLSMAINGWLLDTPALLGYKFNNRIQLISGSHRVMAARYNGILIPTLIYSYEYIRKIWGRSVWVDLVRTPPMLRDVC